MRAARNLLLPPSAKRAWLILVVLQLVPASVHASVQEPRPTATAVRCTPPPRIDGRLDEAAWEAAPPLGPLVQTEPREGEPASERTEARVLFDDDTLFVGVRCFDDDPGAIVATKMKRDSDLNSDDRLIVVLDTFADRRNGFTFIMNPAGAKVDATIAANGAVVNQAWDGIWEGRATIDAQGWSVELAIPFKSLSFDERAKSWGFNVQRVIKRRLENSRWASARRNAGIYQVSEAGSLVGLEGIRQGIGLDVVPFFSLRAADHAGESSHLLGQPGFDAFYRLSPSLGTALTVNTDFADTEVDQRRINLTRFPLFFPEKRDFFLQDSGVFQFADLESDLIPFFSRRIGLSEQGEAIPIDVGAKLTGRVGDVQLGLLDAKTAASGDVESANLAVARVLHDFGEQSSLGGIVTHGDPDGTGRNTLAGFDVNLRRSDFLGSRNLRTSAWWLGTSTAEDAQADTRVDSAFGVSVAYPNDIWSWSVSAKEIGSDFQPALGFVPRTGIRAYAAELEYEIWTNAAVRRLGFGLEPQVVTDLEGELESAATSLQLVHVLWDSGDELDLSLTSSSERLSEPFEIEDGVTLDAGEYDWWRWRVEAESALKRPLTVFAALEGGDFYDGERQDLEAGLSWRPVKYFNAEVFYELNRLDLPAGAFDAHVGGLRLDFAATPDLTWSHFLQFDNDSDSLGWNSRLQWILAPGESINLVVNQVVERVDGSFVAAAQDATLLFQYTFRF